MFIYCVWYGHQSNKKFILTAANFPYFFNSNILFYNRICVFKNCISHPFLFSRWTFLFCCKHVTKSSLTCIKKKKLPRFIYLMTLKIVVYWENISQYSTKYQDIFQRPFHHFLANNGMTPLPHTPYSPNLALCNFFLFPWKNIILMMWKRLREKKRGRSLQLYVLVSLNNVSNKGIVN